MAYKKSVYVKAKALLDERRREAERDQLIRHSAAILACPEIAEIENEMARCGADVVKAVGMGGDVQAYVRELAAKNLAAQEKRRFLLRQSGFPEDYLETKYHCSICKDTGSHDGLYCECYSRLIRDVARKELDSRGLISKCTFESFSTDLYPDVTDSVIGKNQREHMKGVLEFCKNYADRFTLDSKGLLMMGKTGLGKTHLSLAIANRVFDKGYDVYYDSIHNIMDKLEKEHFGRLNPEDSIRDTVLSCDLLIIDDLGVEFSTQFTISEVHNIINTRMINGVPTIISTNLSIAELEEKYSQRITSRIIGDCQPLFFCGKDIRQMK